MKNYELIAELNKYPVGHEVIFEAIVKDDDCMISVDTDLTQVTSKINDVEFTEKQIILC